MIITTVCIAKAPGIKPKLLHVIIFLFLHVVGHGYKKKLSCRKDDCAMRPIVFLIRINLLGFM